MKSLPELMDWLAGWLEGRSFAIILAGHNGSGKSTMWHKHLSGKLKIPLINADRMMLSLLPEASMESPLPEWAVQIRDCHADWMNVAQKGVEDFTTLAMGRKVNFAMETVFSHWKVLENGKVESKIDKIHQLQKEGYFVVLLFVGLMDAQLSIARVKTRVEDTKTPGHDVPVDKLIQRFPRTQEAIRHAITEADTAILVDNSRTPGEAYTVCRVQMEKNVLFDLRQEQAPPFEITAWMDKVCPL